MKKITALMVAMVCCALGSMAQPDSTTISILNDTMPASVSSSYDTIHVGNMIIVRKGSDRSNPNIYRRNYYANQNVVTNWFIIDLGFNQVNDKTNYTQAIATGYLPAGANSDWFNQRNFKSTNVNIWIFMQRLNMIKHVVNLKYGAGLELNNYKYEDNIRFQKTNKPEVIMDVADYRKNKLAADYLTVPVMLNFNFAPERKNGFGFSAGASAGYLYSSRQKTVGGGKGKVKYHDDYDLRKFKISYIAELLFGPIKLYASYATKSMFKNSLDQTPYNFGIRISQ
ncbi:MAG: outer membrane beta-barrel protein [Flavitalea sp.]